MPECGMMQFMAAYFKIPFRTVEGMRGEIVESLYRLYLRHRTVQLRLEAHRIRPGGLFPLFMEAALVKKYDGQVLEDMFFQVSVMNSGASEESRGQAYPGQSMETSGPSQTGSLHFLCSVPGAHDERVSTKVARCAC